MQTALNHALIFHAYRTPQR